MKSAPCAAAVASFLACCVFGSSTAFAFWEDGLVVEDVSIYNYLQVKETDHAVILSTNVMFGVQSIKMKEDGLTGMYYDYALAAPLMAGLTEEREGDVLILGMGTGTYAVQGLRYFPNLRFEGVEIDQKIADLARTYFDLPEEVEVATYDGRAYLDASDKQYDVIMVDAYQDITIPFQMSTVEFFTSVKEHLKEGGVMVVNMNMYSESADNINDYLSDTIASVFPEVVTAAVADNTNCELFACSVSGGEERFRRSIPGLKDPALRKMMAAVSSGLTPYTGKDRILTDDKAPVEVLGMRELDRIIGDELSDIQTIYHEQGFAGLMEQVR